MLVSIITPSYNSSSHIRATYESIIAQTYLNWEWLITDDCSTDESWQLIQEFAQQDNRIKPLQNAVNSGAAVSRNNSIIRSEGEFIAFLDSDDIWLPQKLELHIAFMQKNYADLSFTSYYLIDELGNTLNTVVDSKLKGAFSYNDMLLKKATMGCCTVIVRKNAFTDITMPLIRAGQDYALWLKLLKTGKNAVIYNKPLSQYRIVSNSLSRNKYKKALKIWQVYREIEQLNLLKASYVFCHYALRALLKINECDTKS
ncbi:glycosyltransferase family 2 protein [Thalassotalea piscium]|uniref:Teichuronic acid biosynthesis glycosyltransferase TuaG n=1 Tax=Thalassotalea piscium TaxID=1230533 RepID=A0A7X0NG51_9GAMM|nr:glycosyltransferase [Thalassotalea piscium]MBB6542750.1 teichuronic acid biosynthesis glycosyltransferase TuaG [Thalassotalea piscium]